MLLVRFRVSDTSGRPPWGGPRHAGPRLREENYVLRHGSVSWTRAGCQAGSTPRWSQKSHMLTYARYALLLCPHSVPNGASRVPGARCVQHTALGASTGPLGIAQAGRSPPSPPSSTAAARGSPRSRPLPLPLRCPRRLALHRVLECARELRPTAACRDLSTKL